MKWKKPAPAEAQSEAKAPEPAASATENINPAEARRKAMYDQMGRVEMMRRRDAAE